MEFVERRRISQQNRLALCPTCAAKWQYVRMPTDEEVLVRLSECRATDGRTFLPVTLADTEHQVLITGRHLLDLTVIHAEGDPDGSEGAEVVG